MNNKLTTLRRGVYATMITPYRDGRIDETATKKLVHWYWKTGCDGIFAVCQSSESPKLTIEERLALARLTISTAKELAAIDTSRPPLSIVISGHVADDPDEQAEDLCRLAAEGPDGLALITNRMDQPFTSDEAWIRDTETLIARLPSELPLGLYECPKPYKRLLSDTMLRWCVDSGRFEFVKDTCCDAALFLHRLEICRGSRVLLFNANAQTLLTTLKAGSPGYSSVMANFHPELYVRLCHGDLKSTEASLLQDYLGLAAMVEALTYPCCAKDYLNRFRGIAMETTSRTANEEDYTPYQRDCITQFAELSHHLMRQLGIEPVIMS